MKRSSDGVLDTGLAMGFVVRPFSTSLGRFIEYVGTVPFFLSILARDVINFSKRGSGATWANRALDGHGGAAEDSSPRQ